MMNNYQLFYEYVKDQLLRDQRLPSIKAEVIWDMLLTDFVADLIAYKGHSYGNHNEVHDEPSDDKDATGEYILLMKEFPIDNGKDGNRQSAKADYLVLRKKDGQAADGKGFSDMYIIELKTSKSSEGEKQFQRYEALNRENTGLLWSFYNRIINQREGITKKPMDRNSTEKYMNQVELINKEYGDYLIDLWSENSSERLEEATKDSQIHVVYICLYPCEEARGDIRFVGLYQQNGDSWDVNQDLFGFMRRRLSSENVGNPERLKKWELIEEILKDNLTFDEITFDKGI